MESFTKLDCGCYVGFDVHHKPIRGKQCPLHETASEMYQALKDITSRLKRLDKLYSKDLNVIDKAEQALAKANGSKSPK